MAVQGKIGAGILGERSAESQMYITKMFVKI